MPRLNLSCMAIHCYGELLHGNLFGRLSDQHCRFYPYLSFHRKGSGGQFHRVGRQCHDLQRPRYSFRLLLQTRQNFMASHAPFKKPSQSINIRGTSCSVPSRPFLPSAFPPPSKPSMAIPFSISPSAQFQSAISSSGLCTPAAGKSSTTKQQTKKFPSTSQPFRLLFLTSYPFSQLLHITNILSKNRSNWSVERDSQNAAHFGSLRASRSGCPSPLR